MQSTPIARRAGSEARESRAVMMWHDMEEISSRKSLAYHWRIRGVSGKTRRKKGFVGWKARVQVVVIEGTSSSSASWMMMALGSAMFVVVVLGNSIS